MNDVIEIINLLEKRLQEGGRDYTIDLVIRVEREGDAKNTEYIVTDLLNDQKVKHNA